MRRLHCIEAPEPFFEDFRRARLNNGTATVNLDPDFAALVDATDYHVFIQPEDADGAIRVTARTSGSFTVKEACGTSSGTFSWRLVARRDDLKGYARLERVANPASAPTDVHAAQLTIATVLTEAAAPSTTTGGPDGAIRKLDSPGDANTP